MLKVQVGGVEGHEPREQHALGVQGLIRKVVAVEKASTLGGVRVEVNIQGYTAGTAGRGKGHWGVVCGGGDGGGGGGTGR